MEPGTSDEVGPGAGGVGHDGPAKVRLSGGCLCGGVRYRVRGPVRDVIGCHCERCRRTTGHMMAATAAPRDAVELTTDATLRWYHPVDDPHVAYGFCTTCGASLFWRADGSDTMSITAGTIDPPTGLALTEVLFADQRPDYLGRVDPVERTGEQDREPR